ncbi:MAG: T9SS type A sorting domain-containing protein [Bacteroidetes bacterium]|nr:T9SS type A sorting domain-containing protein [Bacteroidota bacterium]
MSMIVLRTRYYLLLLPAVHLFLGSQANTQWLSTGKRLSTVASNVNVALPPFTQNGNICSDGAGGAIVIWSNNSPPQVRMQRLNHLGQELWGTGGMVLAENPSGVFDAQVTATNDGNFVAIWVIGNVTGNLYAQKLRPSGERAWGDSAVRVCSSPLSQYWPQVAATNSGGVVIVWEDFRDGIQSDIFAQKMRADGTKLWQPDGLPVCTAPLFQNFPKITHTSDDRTMIFWEDGRNGYYEIWGNILDSSGVKLLGPNGRQYFARYANASYPKLVTDKQGSSFVAWRHNTRGQYDLYAQKLDTAGNPLWGSGRSPVDTLINTYDPFIISDDNGGVYLSWTSTRPALPWASVQRIRADGTLTFADSGLHVSATTDGQSWPVLAGDGNGGCFIAWNDHRFPFDDVRCQRIDSGGTLLWQSDGIPVAVGNDNQRYPQLMLTDSGNCIVIWTDRRDGTTYHLYASMIRPNGNIVTGVDDAKPVLSTAFSLAQNFPNPFNPATTISFSLPHRSHVSLKVFDLLGREVAILVSGELSSGEHSRTWTATGVSSGVYLCRLEAGSLRGTRKLMLIR